MLQLSKSLHLILFYNENKFEKDDRCSRNSPCVLDDQKKIMLDCKFYSRSNVTDRASIDSDNWDVTLLAGYAQSSIHITCADGPVFEGECLKIGTLHGPRLVKMPVTIKLGGLCICAVFRRMRKWVTF